MKWLVAVLAILIASAAAACNRSHPASTTVLIVRHAEKASDADDSPLNDAGTERAQALVRVAEEAHVSAIYSSQFLRTHETAQPLSNRLGIPVTEMPVNLANPGDYGSRLANDILRNHAGQTVVVVGHANTVAAVIEGLTGHAEPIKQVDYGDLFVVTVPPSGAAGVTRAQYGSRSGG